MGASSWLTEREGRRTGKHRRSPPGAGIYYFTNGFRAASGSKIVGEGVTIFVDQTKVLDISQNVAWQLSAPKSGPTAGVAIMGDPRHTSAGTVRLIGVLGNVEGAIYFPHQTLQTESGPDRVAPVCTNIIANLIDVRGSGAVRNDCSKGSSVASSVGIRVRLVKGPLA